MNNTAFLQRIHSGEMLVSDGATGTNLQQRGLSAGRAGEVWVIERPGEIARLHREFIAAGSDIILTCTFGGTSIRLAQEGLERAQRRSQPARRWPSHMRLPRTLGCWWQVRSAQPGRCSSRWERWKKRTATNAFEEQAKALTDAGVDLLVVETQYDLAEAEPGGEGRAGGQRPAAGVFIQL